MEQFFIVLNQIGIFLILIIFGILAVKFGILDEHSLGSVSKLVMRMALPAYIFINTAEGATRQGLAESLLVIPLAIALYLMLFLLSLLLEKVFQLKGNRSHVFRAIVMFGNVGFMGIPLVVELYPDTALLYISLFTILDQGLFWTYGVSLTKPVSDQKEKVSLKNLKNLLSPALIAIVGATILVEGTTKGTTSGADGSFSIKAAPDNVLVVSFMGYQSHTIKVGTQTRIDVVLKENTQAIDDVIVVAFGTAKKEAFTGSATVHQIGRHRQVAAVERSAGSGRKGRGRAADQHLRTAGRESDDPHPRFQFAQRRQRSALDRGRHALLGRPEQPQPE